MKNNNYVVLVTQLTALIHKFEELENIHNDASFDLKTRIVDLFKDVDEKYRDKFINLSGMKNFIPPMPENNIVTIDNILEKNEELEKECIKKAWVKKLYRKSIKRCHPDTNRSNSHDYNLELLEIYKNIVESYDNNMNDRLMVYSHKLLVKPEIINREQTNILEISIIDYQKKIKEILSSQPIAWFNFDDNMKEIFLINFMKQNGVKFIDKEKIKKIVKRKIKPRKTGQRPKNNLKNRVK